MDFSLNSSTQTVENIEFHLTRASDRYSVHAYRKIDDLQDGTYLFRYRLYESVENLHFYIRFGYENLEHVVQGHLYSDGCYCPESNQTEWLDALECSSSSLPSHLHEDLKLFKQIDMRQVMDQAREKYFQYPQTYALCHYAIKNNKVEPKTHCSDEYFLHVDLSKMLWSICGF